MLLLTSETHLAVFGDLSFTQDPGLLDGDLSPDIDIGRPSGCKLDDCSENIDLGLLSDDCKREGRFFTFSNLIIRNSRLDIFFFEAVHKVIESCKGNVGVRDHHFRWCVHICFPTKLLFPVIRLVSRFE